MSRQFLAMTVAMIAMPIALAGQGKQHVLVVSGLSGEPAYAKQFGEAARQIVDSARTRWGVPAANVAWLAEDPASDPRRITGKATREGIGAAFTAMARRTASDDQVLVVLVGHGSGEGAASRIALPGPDPTAGEYATWLNGLGARRVVVIVAASGSGDFLPVLSAPGRVVITATRSASERNASVFAGFIATALSTDEADADKNGSTTLLEAYIYARTAVAAAYSDNNKLLTEHAQLDDNGDKAGTADPGRAAGGDGAIARQVVFARPGAGVRDPRAATLLAERTALEQQLERLRQRKASTDSITYQRELERLLLEIAARTRDIRSLESGARP